jgi:peptidoglycan/xylan/chitin deacetylase (PgdA/CDA1 family)
MLSKSRLLRNAFTKINRSYRIVYYHIISDDKYDYYFNNSITVNEFEDQIKYFKRNFIVISVEEAILKYQNGESLDGYLSITTDDGFAGNYNITAPILLENKMTSTMFITTKFIDNNDLMWRNKLIYIQNNVPQALIKKTLQNISSKYYLDGHSSYSDLMIWSYKSWKMYEKDSICNELWDELIPISLKEWLAMNKPYLSTSQILELANNGFSYGGHTRSHPICNRLTYSELIDEVMGSCLDLNGILGSKVKTISYPFNIRPDFNIEKKMSDQLNIIGYLGGKSKLSNHNPLSWDRDLQECRAYEREFRFYLLPLVRKMNILDI